MKDFYINIYSNLNTPIRYIFLTFSYHYVIIPNCILYATKPKGGNVMAQNTRTILLERAQKIREKAVEFVLMDNYEAFLELAFIGEDIWNTPSAKEFRLRLKSAVTHKNKAFLMQIPEILEKSASKLPTPSPFNFSYDGLLKKAEEIDFYMIDFILNGDYAGLQKLATISEDIWSGTNAEKYKMRLDEAIRTYDKKYIASIPSFLRKKAEELLTNEKLLKKVLSEKYKIDV